MRSLPTPPSPGKPVSATLIRQLIAAIRERTVLQGRNVTIKRGPNGTVINANVKPGTCERVSKYWSFSCTEDPETGERTGGWKNCRLQIGLNCMVASEDVFGPQSNLITGTEQCDDGFYYVEVNLRDETADIKLSDNGASAPPSDIEHDKVNFNLGYVIEGNQIHCIDCIPVIYKYL